MKRQHLRAGELWQGVEGHDHASNDQSGEFDALTQGAYQVLDAAYGQMQRLPGLERPGDIPERWPT